jgi:hypothetical protein
LVDYPAEVADVWRPNGYGEAMSDPAKLSAEELASLRDKAIPWEEAYRLAQSCAVDTVAEMREAFNQFAQDDPYETRRSPGPGLEMTAKETEPALAGMTRFFMNILNRRGLLKIDPG